MHHHHQESGGLTIDADSLARMPIEQSYRLPLEELCDLQLRATQARFAALVDKVPLLSRLANEQNIGEIGKIEDVGPLLLPHSAFKSYPLSFLERGRFDLLTRWLDGLTSSDLSKVDAKGCETIDDWIDLLDTQTPLRVAHSTGTSGKLSFIPRGLPEQNRLVSGFLQFFEPFGDEPTPFSGTRFEDTYLLFPQYRYGAMAQHRLLNGLAAEKYGGDESRIVTLNPGRFSADVASIGGRLKGNEARGESNRISLPPKLLARREAFIKEQQNVGGFVETLLDTINTRLRGQKVNIVGHPGMMLDIAVAAKARGMSKLFAPDSFAMVGGGTKGRALPDDWQETILNFLGVPQLRSGYGMTEMIRTASRDCPQGFYHLPISTVPFLLDHDSGAQLPRTGTQTGRFGFFDLLITSFWGGFLTGDQVTISFGDTEPCACGRVGAYAHSNIRRFTEAEGGDDKITCAGAPDAHDKALDFIIKSAS